LTRDAGEIRAQAERLLPALARAVAGHAGAGIADVASQIGSGALPVDLLASAALRLTVTAPTKRQGTALKRLAAAFRALPRPVIGRVHDGALLFDLRCLDDEAVFAAQLDKLVLP
jgi:L-seryl-tRNA(Ser) seleniumtransferase